MVVIFTLLWPEFLRVPLGLAQMSVPRFAALVIIAKQLSSKDAMRFRWNWIDAMVLGGWAWELAANIFAGADQTVVTYMIGRVFDTASIYLAARLSLRGAKDYADLVPPLMLVAVTMGIFGFLESAVMHQSVYERIFGIVPEQWFVKEDEFRYGFLRAKASTGHAIYFGMAMVVITGMLVALQGFAGRYRYFIWPAIGCGFLGALSSMSSGPQLALVILLITSSFWFYKGLIKPALVALLLLAVIAEAGSNRHFYQLIDYLALSSETAWYRTRLLEVAVGHMREYWLVGLGGRSPHHWALEIDGRLHVDLVNHFVIVATQGGLLGLGMYLGAIVGAIKSAARVASKSQDRAFAKAGFFLVCLLLAIANASMSVGLFGAPLLLTYALLGAMVALPGAATTTLPNSLGPSSARARSAGGFAREARS
ncbi:MAG: hypothetical protein U0572_16610 [Phycisphaerales bacterium]